MIPNLMVPESGPVAVERLLSGDSDPRDVSAAYKTPETANKQGK